MLRKNATKVLKIFLSIMSLLCFCTAENVCTVWNLNPGTRQASVGLQVWSHMKYHVYYTGRVLRAKGAVKPHSTALVDVTRNSLVVI